MEITRNTRNGTPERLLEQPFRAAIYPFRCSVPSNVPGWDSNEERINPEASAKLFYKALMQVTNRDQMEIGVAAQTVQRSAFPDFLLKMGSYGSSDFAESKRDEKSEGYLKINN